MAADAREAAVAAPAPPVEDADPVTLSAVGDTVMGSLPYGLPSDGGASFFDSVEDLLVGDVVLGNLEGTLATGGTSKCGSGSPNCFAFRTPPSYARYIKEAGFTVMNLANNHANDFGPSALRESVAALSRVRHPQHRPPRDRRRAEGGRPARRGPRLRVLRVGRPAARHPPRRAGACRRRRPKRRS